MYSSPFLLLFSASVGERSGNVHRCGCGCVCKFLVFSGHFCYLIMVGEHAMDVVYLAATNYICYQIEACVRCVYILTRPLF